MQRLLHRLGRSLAELPGPPEKYAVAFSGGLDSTVLLAAMARLTPRPALRALHVDHGLHPDSRAWERYCKAVARTLGAGYASRRRLVEPVSGESLEARARRIRYRALEELLAPGEALLTAHHADDQLETVLMRLLRGAGVRGLRGIARWRQFGPGFMARPLLEIPRAEIRAAAEAWGLEWLEDPSNRDPRFDRNYLRAELIPRIAARWPAAARTVGRTARQMADAQQILDEVARADAAQVDAAQIETAAQADAVQSDAVQSDAVQVDAAQVETAAQADAVQSDAAQAAAVQADAVQSDAVQVNVVQADAAQVDAVPVDAVQADAVQVDVVQADASHGETAAQADAVHGDTDVPGLRGRSGRIDCAALRGLSTARQGNLLRHALVCLGMPVPDARQQESLLAAIQVRRRDARTRVQWPGGEARVYRDRLYLLEPLPDASPAGYAGEVSLARPWHGPEGRLRLVPGAPPGLPRQWAEQGLTVRFREGGERFRPTGRRHVRPLKKWLQEAGIPPWMRARIPLLFREGALAAVGDLWISAAAGSGADDRPRWRVEWTDHPPLT